MKERHWIVPLFSATMILCIASMAWSQISEEQLGPQPLIAAGSGANLGVKQLAGGLPLALAIGFFISFVIPGIYSAIEFSRASNEAYTHVERLAHDIGKLALEVPTLEISKSKILVFDNQERWSG